MWKTDHRCTHCRLIISDYKRLNSDGTCPWCGSKHHDAVTVVHTTEHAYYNERIGKWWQFWKYKKVYKEPFI